MPMSFMQGSSATAQQSQSTERLPSDVHERDVAAEVIDHGLGCFGHRLDEIILFGVLVPEFALVEGCTTRVDVHLALIRSTTDRKLFERTAKAAHRMPFEVREYEHRSVVRQVATHTVILQHAAILDREDDVGARAIRIHDVYIEVLGPAVCGHELLVLFGGIARAIVGSVALDDRARPLLRSWGA